MTTNTDLNLDTINELNKKKDYKGLIKELILLTKKQPEQYQPWYLLGSMFFDFYEYESANECFKKAEELGCTKMNLYVSMAIISSSLNFEAEAEGYFNKALLASKSDTEKWSALSNIALFYLNTKQLLKAEKTSNEMISSFPSNYQGYHIKAIIYCMRNEYDDALSYIQNIQSQFIMSPQLLIDYLEIYKHNNADMVDKLFEEDTRFVEIIPRVVLQQKLKLFLKDGKKQDKCQEILTQLSQQFNDTNAILSLMILAHGEKDFCKSADFAMRVLEKEMNAPSFSYYIALYFQIYNFYHLSKQKPSEQLLLWMKDATKQCVEFVCEFNNEEFTDDICNSLQQLFDSINGKDTLTE